MDGHPTSTVRYCATEFRNHRAPINTVSFSEDGAYLASGGDDHYIYVYKLVTDKINPGSGRLLQKLSPHQGQLTAVKWVQYPTSTGTYFFVSAGADGTVMLWKKGENQTRFECIAVKLVSFRLAIEDIDIYDRKLVVAGGSGVQAYNLALDATARFIPHTLDFQYKNTTAKDAYGTAMTVRFIRRARVVLAGYVDGKILSGWTWATGKQTILEALNVRPARMEYHENSQTLAVCNLNNGVDLYNLADEFVKIGTIIMDVPPHRIYHFQMRFGREGEIIVGGLFGKAYIYRLSDKGLLKTLIHSNKPVLVQAVAYYQCADYALIATGSSEDRQPGTIKVWSSHRRANKSAILTSMIAVICLAPIAFDIHPNLPAVQQAVRVFGSASLGAVVLSVWGKAAMAIVAFTQAYSLIERRPLWRDAAKECFTFLILIAVQLTSPVWEMTWSILAAARRLGWAVLESLGEAGRDALGNVWGQARLRPTE